MNSVMRLGAATVAVLLLSACATVTRGTKQSYKITSEPTGANVALTTGQSCVTPCKLKLKRKHGFTAKVTKEGYEPTEATVASKFAGGGGAAVAGNVLIGGIIGAAVDGSNGSMNSLFPDKLDFKLKPIAVAAPAATEAAPAEAVSSDTVATAPAAPVEPATPAEAAPAAPIDPALAPTGDQLR